MSDIHWATRKLLCLKAARQVKIADGTLDRNFIEFEMKTMSEAKKGLESVLSGMTPKLRDSVGTRLVDNAQELSSIIESRIKDITEMELRR